MHDYMRLCVCVQQGSGKGEAWRSGLEEMLGSSVPASRPQHRPSHSADPKVSTVCVPDVQPGFGNLSVTTSGTHSPKRTIYLSPDGVSWLEIMLCNGAEQPGLLPNRHAVGVSSYPLSPTLNPPPPLNPPNHLHPQPSSPLLQRKAT